MKKVANKKKTTKLSEDQLKSLQGHVNGLNGLKASLGEIEMQKHALLHQAQVHQTQLQVLQAEIEKEFGNDVNVDLTTGEVKKQADVNS